MAVQICIYTPTITTMRTQGRPAALSEQAFKAGDDIL